MSDLVVQAGGGGAGDSVGAAPESTPTAPVAGPAEVNAAPVAARRARPRRSAENQAAWRSIVEEWHKLVADASAARLPPPTVRGFCEQRQLREPSFYWWRRECAIQDGRPLPTKRSPDSTHIVSHLGAHPATAPKAAFVQLRVKPAQPVVAPSGALCDLVVGKLVVRVSPGFDADELARLLDVLTTTTR